MAIIFDPDKCLSTLSERGLDFAEAESVLTGRTVSWIDKRFDYGEERIVSVGHLADRMVVLVWTWRGDDRRIISMRKASEDERQLFGERLGRS